MMFPLVALVWNGHGVLGFVPAPVEALTLTMPAADTALTAGQALPVAVDVGREASERPNGES